MRGKFVLDREKIKALDEISPSCSVLYMRLVLMANWTASCVRHNGKSIELKRGQLVTSIEHLMGLTGLSESTIRRTLRRLVDERACEQASGFDGTLITIIDYDGIQDFAAEGESRLNVPMNEGVNGPMNTPVNNTLTNKHINELTNKQISMSKKLKKPTGAIEGLEMHSETLSQVSQEIQHGWVKLAGSSAAVAREITKAKNWALDKRRKVRSWQRFLNNWMGNVEPQAIEPDRMIVKVIDWTKM